VLCAVTIPPPDLRLSSLYYYTVCGRMCMSTVRTDDIHMRPHTIPPADLRSLSLYYCIEIVLLRGHILCNNTNSTNANQREE
jgi:hypothetical protein